MRLHRSLSNAGADFDWHYVECADLEEFQRSADRLAPDVILVNGVPSTLPWAMNGISHGDALTAAVFHEASQSAVTGLCTWPFDVLLCPDPTLRPRDPRAASVPRFMPGPLLDLPPPPEVFTIGSFGFGTSGKGFDRLCALVDKQFDVARIRINIPVHDSLEMVPSERVRAITAACRAAVTKPGIQLEFTHHFFDEVGLLRFLAENTLNAFLYDDMPGRGISSCVDYALAAGRPIAVSRSSMFRHLAGANPSICVEDRPLAAIAASGTVHLALHRCAYAEAAAGRAWNEAIERALASRRLSQAVPDGRGYNKLLDDRAREAYAEPLKDLSELAPDVLSRKIERANIQQAFALDTVRRLALRFSAPRILAIGSYEDTAVASLRALGYRIDEIDPQVNGMDLEGFYRTKGAGVSYDLILCVSVLEHVADDEAFVRQAAALLAVDGVAVFTVDFSSRFPDTGQCPAADHRLYTAKDLSDRLMGVLPGCCLLDRPRWDEGAEDFEYDGCQYAFATWTFARLWHETAVEARQSDGAAGPPWKVLLSRTEEAKRALDERLAIAHLETTRLSGEAARLRSEIHDFRANLLLANPPIALRLTLPLARALRSLRRMLRSDGPQQAQGAAPSMPPESGSPPPVQRRGLARRLLRSAYIATVRPVVRPVLWRIRGFMTAPVIEELRTQTRRSAGDSVSTTGDVRLAQAMEAALLTLAVEGRSGMGLPAHALEARQSSKFQVKEQSLREPH
jgi:SAM-dependent methyltransferase